MRENYDNCIFVVASDDIEWCKKHIDATQGDVFFSGMYKFWDILHTILSLSIEFWFLIVILYFFFNDWNMKQGHD